MIKSVPAIGLTVLGRSTAHDLNEFADKVIAVLISYVLCNTVDLLICTDDLLCSFFDPVICQVILKRHTVLFPEDLSQVRVVNMIFVSEILKADVFSVILLDLSFDLGQDSVRDAFSKFR